MFHPLPSRGQYLEDQRVGRIRTILKRLCEPFLDLRDAQILTQPLPFPLLEAFKWLPVENSSAIARTNEGFPVIGSDRGSVMSFIGARR